MIKTPLRIAGMTVPLQLDRVSCNGCAIQKHSMQTNSGLTLKISHPHTSCKRDGVFRTNINKGTPGGTMTVTQNQLSNSRSFSVVVSDSEGTLPGLYEPYTGRNCPSQIHVEAFG